VKSFPLVRVIAMLEIKRTGFDNWLDGSANIKMLIAGGAGVGKTRGAASAWPKPIIADTEGGLASVADLRVPFVAIKSSKDMFDLVDHLKSLEKIPKAQREYQTVVIDTIDSFQRILQDEWIVKNKASSFSGFDAWGYLNTKMGMLLTRLLNLDYNIVINVHYKDKSGNDDDPREFELLLSGQTRDHIVNDFDLVGWMDVYWTPDETGKRIESRAITFKRSPRRPMLKDRFNVMPEFLPVTFSHSDYDVMREAFEARANDFVDVEVVGVIGMDSEAGTGELATGDGGEIPERVSAPAAVAPEGAGTGPVAPRPAGSPDIRTLGKADLVALAKEMGLPVRGNTLKGEMITMIVEAQKKTGQVITPVETAVPPPVEALAAPVEKVQEVQAAEPEAAPVEPEPVVSVEVLAHELKAEIIADDRPPVQTRVETPVDQAEIEDTKPVDHKWGGSPAVAAPSLPSEQVAAHRGADASSPFERPCPKCNSADLAAEKRDILMLSKVKFGKEMCRSCFDTAKANA